MKASYPYLLGDRGYTMSCAEVKLALGLIPDERHPRYGYLLDARVPPEASTPWIDIQGVSVKYLSTADARERAGKTRGMAMRAFATCPECAKVVAASRINQHARVHHAGVRKGY